MPNKADLAIKFLIQQLTDKKLDPRLDSESVIDLYKNDTTIREEIRHQLTSYISTTKLKSSWQSYWYRLRRCYLNEFENLDPARNGPGPGPIPYPRSTLRFEGDIMTIPNITISRFVTNVELYLNLLMNVFSHVIWLQNTAPMKRNDTYPVSGDVKQTCDRVYLWNKAIVKHFLMMTNQVDTIIPRERITIIDV